MTLIDDVKRSVERECQGLTPDGDSLPTLLYRDADDNRYVLGLAVDMNDDTALLMTASLLLDEATEAIYSGLVWSVRQDLADVDDQYQGPMPSQHPDRVEQAMIVHYTPDGMAVHFAPVTRSVDAAPMLGEWATDNNFTKVGGRIAHAIEGGLRMAANMPDEMRSVFRAAKAAGDEARKGALRGTIGALRGASIL